MTLSKLNRCGGSFRVGCDYYFRANRALVCAIVVKEIRFHFHPMRDGSTPRLSINPVSVLVRNCNCKVVICPLCLTLSRNCALRSLLFFRFIVSLIVAPVYPLTKNLLTCQTCILSRPLNFHPLPFPWR